MHQNAFDKDTINLGGRDKLTPSRTPESEATRVSLSPNNMQEKSKHSGEGHNESAIPENRDAEALDHIEQDWGCDPDNARNWPASQKWLAVSIVSTGSPFLPLPIADILEQVSLYTFSSPLASSFMAPGLQEVAVKYDITSSTVLALTLSIFLLSFAIAVRVSSFAAFECLLKPL